MVLHGERPVAETGAPRTLAAYGYVTSSPRLGQDLMRRPQNFARASVRLRPSDNNRNVVRGGYGSLRLGPDPRRPYRLINGNPPFVLNETFTSGATSPTITLADPFPALDDLANPNTPQSNAICATPIRNSEPHLERELSPTSGCGSLTSATRPRAIQYAWEHNNPLLRLRATPAESAFPALASISSMSTNGNAFTNQLQWKLSAYLQRLVHPGQLQLEQERG